MAARAPVPRPRRGATVLGGADRGEEEGVRGLAAPLHGMAARQSAEREAVERARRSAAARGPPEQLAAAVATATAPESTRKHGQAVIQKAAKLVPGLVG